MVNITCYIDLLYGGWGPFPCILNENQHLCRNFSIMLSCRVFEGASNGTTPRLIGCCGAEIFPTMGEILTMLGES